MVVTHADASGAASEVGEVLELLRADGRRAVVRMIFATRATFDGGRASFTLVEDVITTGGAVRDAARALREAGAPAVCGVPGGGSSLDLLAALKRARPEIVTNLVLLLVNAVVVVPLIAVPILMLVVLLIFRSPVAAAIPLLIAGGTTGTSTDEEAEEEAEAALSTVDSEFGRTTDPVRMYMREMGTVELLTREGEIAIAKRIEEGLHQVQNSLAAFPWTIQIILDDYALHQEGKKRLSEIVTGFADLETPELFGGDPIEAALRWQEAGAEWIHLVDLERVRRTTSLGELLPLSFGPEHLAAA